MTRFILNDTLVESDAPEGTVLLDIIRYHQQLKGTRSAAAKGIVARARYWSAN